MAYLEGGKLERWGTSEQLTELGQGKKLLHVVEGWLRSEKEVRLAEAAKQPAKSLEAAVKPNRTPMMPSKHLAFFR
jgi:CCR4-NOT complex subunit CAF16